MAIMLIVFLPHKNRNVRYPKNTFHQLYINNFPGASDLRTLLMLAQSTDKIREILREYPSENND